MPYTRSLVVYISASLWLSAHKTLVYSIRVSQGSVATRLRCGGIFEWHFYSKFSAECASERSLKIRWELTKLSIWASCTTFWNTVYLGLFFRTAWLCRRSYYVSMFCRSICSQAFHFVNINCTFLPVLFQCVSESQFLSSTRATFSIVHRTTNRTKKLFNGSTTNRNSGACE